MKFSLTSECVIPQKHFFESSILRGCRALSPSRVFLYCWSMSKPWSKPMSTGPCGHRLDGTLQGNETSNCLSIYINKHKAHL